MISHDTWNSAKSTSIVALTKFWLLKRQNRWGESENGLSVYKKEALRPFSLSTLEMITEDKWLFLFDSFYRRSSFEHVDIQAISRALVLPMVLTVVTNK